MFECLTVTTCQKFDAAPGMRRMHVKRHILPHLGVDLSDASTRKCEQQWGFFMLHMVNLVTS
jgi:hypothetical protein